MKQNPKKRPKLNPADLNFIPNPQFLMETIQKEDIEDGIVMDLMDSTDVNLAYQEEEMAESVAKVKKIALPTREEELIEKSGKFKYLKNVPENTICRRCDRTPEFLAFEQGKYYCAIHCVQRAMENYENLTHEEICKKDYLEKFMINIKKTKVDLEEVKSFLNKSRLVTQENNSLNLKRVNRLFKIIFEETKHLYSCFLDQIGKKIGESEVTHKRSIEVIKDLEKNILVIDGDIDENYANIVLNMEMNPFQEIMQSYEEKIKENLEGISGAREELSKLNQIQIEFQKVQSEGELGKHVTKYLFELITSVVKENDSSYNFQNEAKPHSKDLSLKGLEVSQYLENSRKNTKILRGEAQKVIEDLNTVIERLEVLKKKDMKTPMKDETVRLGYYDHQQRNSYNSRKMKRTTSQKYKEKVKKVPSRLRLSGKKVLNDTKRNSKYSRLGDFYRTRNKLKSINKKNPPKTPDNVSHKNWSKIISSTKKTSPRSRLSSKGKKTISSKKMKYYPSYYKTKDLSKIGVKPRKYELYSQKSRLSSASSKGFQEENITNSRHNFSRGLGTGEKYEGKNSKENFSARKYYGLTRKLSYSRKGGQLKENKAYLRQIIKDMDQSSRGGFNIGKRRTISGRAALGNDSDDREDYLGEMKKAGFHIA